MKNLAILVLTLIASQLSLADGSGFNGPTFKTIAIPGSVEHGIRATEVAQAYDTCLVKGRPGLVSTMKKLSYAMTGRNMDLCTLGKDSYGLDKAISNWMTPSRELSLSSAGGQITFPVTAAASPGCQNEFHYWDSVMLGEKLKYRTGLSIKYYIYNAKENKYTEQTFAPVANTVLPVISYKSLNEDKRFDRLGMIKPGATVLFGVAIEAPENYEEDISLKNLETGVVLPDIKLNFGDLVQCLRSEIQRSLK